MEKPNEHNETDQTKARLVYTTFMEKVGPPRLQYELEIRSDQANIDPKAPAQVWAKQAALMAKEATNIAFTLQRHNILWAPADTRPQIQQGQQGNKQAQPKHLISNINSTMDQSSRQQNETEHRWLNKGGQPMEHRMAWKYALPS